MREMVYINPILQIRKLRHRKIKSLARGCTARQWDSNPDGQAPERTPGNPEQCLWQIEDGHKHSNIPPLEGLCVPSSRTRVGLQLT